MSHFRKFAVNQKYSQNGEDAILTELIRQIDIPDPGFFVEFGAGNGKDLCNTLALAERGWRGVWIEQSYESFLKMKAKADSFDGRVTGIHGTVGFSQHDNLDLILRNAGAMVVIDVLSIDIDSYDLQVWEALQQHRSKIVIIEINSGIPLGTRQVHYQGEGEKTQGASFTSMLDLARSKHYQLAAHTGNMIFVDESCARKLDQPQSEIDDPNSLFDNMWVQWAKNER